jgi:hypothetical protein
VTHEGQGTGEPSTHDSRFKSRALLAGLERTESAPKLWFAVLAQAFRDFYGDIISEGPARFRNSHVPYFRRTARAWFLSDSPLPGSFQWIAGYFELDVQAVRKRLFSGKPTLLDESVDGVRECSTPLTLKTPLPVSRCWNQFEKTD